MGKSNLIKKLLITGAHWSPLESIGVGEYRWGHHFLDTVVFTIGANRSPLVLEIVDEGNSNLIKKLLSIRAHSSPLELKNLDGIIIFWTECCLPLESTGVHWSLRLYTRVRSI